MRSLLLTILIACALTLSGCVAEPDDELTGSDDTTHTVTEPLGPVTEELKGNTGISAATPAVSMSNGDSYEFPLPTPVNVTGWVLELVWDANGPESSSLDLWLRKTGDYALPPSDPSALIDNQPTLKATGGSPLRLAASVDALGDVEHSILVRAAGPAGAANGQAFTLHVTTFDGVPFDEMFSALH